MSYLDEIDGAISNLLDRLSRQDLNNIFSSFIDTLSDITDQKDGYTGSHTKRVSQLAYQIASKMDYDREMVDNIIFASKVHDIGKIRIPTSILARPGKLMSTEIDLIKKHVQIGYDILSKIKNIGKIPQIILQHHEREDSSGYPNQLKGSEIMEEAKVISIADMVEAISNSRPYRAAMGKSAAIYELEKHKGVKYSLKLANVTIKLLDDGFEFN